MNGNPPASGEICASASALRTFVIKITPQKKEKKVVSESFHRFFNSLNEWRTSCFSVYGARALDEVRFISFEPSTQSSSMENHCVSYAHQSQFLRINRMANRNRTCGIDTHFHNV